MKQLGIMFCLLAICVFVACGSNSNNNNGNVNGNWSASLTDLNNNPVFAFNTTLTQNSDGTVSGTNLNFTTSTPCFGSGATQTGSFALNGNFNGNVTGAFSLNIQGPSTGNSGTNTLSMQGTLNNNNTITGTWTLAGLQTGCTGSGNFSMVHM